MKPSDPDRKLERLQQATERVAANLVELEIDSGRRLLETTALTGESAERWAAASAALTELWRWHGLLEELNERAYQVKAGRLGVVEDAELGRIFAQAHEALYTAPTDLALVAQLVRRHQQMLAAAEPVPKALR